MEPLFNALVYTVWFLATYFIVLFLLIMFTHKEKLYENRKLKPLQDSLMVSIVVPAYNEEETIAETISSLKNATYKNVEFIIVNDGSKDNTSKVIETAIKNDERFVFIDNEQNKGKAASLNEGIAHAKGQFVACMDADSTIEPGVVEKTLPYFDDGRVGAVTVSVEVKNPKRFIDRIIDIEFSLGLSLFLKVLSFFDCVLVTPGPFSIYRKSMLQEIGGFDLNNITEDLEIAYRIHKSKYKIKHCLEAKVQTIMPPTFKGIYIQRRRWYAGAIYTLIKHKEMLFKKRYGFFGYFIPLNYTLIGLGLLLFVYTDYLSLSKVLKNILYFQYTNFNFLERLFDWEFDILNFNTLSILGNVMFLATIIVMIIGIYFARKSFNDKKWGMVGYPFLFLLYQIFWLGAIVAVVKGKKVKWR